MSASRAKQGGSPAPRNRRSSEHRSYPDVVEDLRRQNWNTNRPSEPGGQVYFQAECGSDPSLAAALGRQAPEYVVVVEGTPPTYWVIEVKGSMKQLDQAVSEARDYAKAINSVAGQRCAFFTGIAGNPLEGYLRRTYFLDRAGHEDVIEFQGAPISSLLPREQLLELLKADTAALSELVLDEAELLRVADFVNEVLHGASIGKDDRASLVASVLLTMAQDNLPRESLPPEAYADQVNLTARSVLARSGQDHLAAHTLLCVCPKAEMRRRSSSWPYAELQTRFAI